MATNQCQQCGKTFEAKRRNAKFCSALCRQHKWRGKRPFDHTTPHPLHHKPSTTPQGSSTFWDLVQTALEEACLLAGSTPGAIVAASIIVMDDDAEIVREKQDPPGTVGTRSARPAGNCSWSAWKA